MTTATVTIHHVPGYSSVDHFGSELAALAQSFLLPAYASRASAGRAGLRAICRAARTFSPCADYSGPRGWPRLRAAVA